MKTQNKNFNTKLLTLLNIIFFYLTFVYIYLFHNSFQDPDYYFYSTYIDYFFNLTPKSNIDLGVLYYFLVSFFIGLSENLISTYTYEFVISNSILITNFLLYGFGLLGLFKFLLIRKFNKNNILFFIFFLNFFPMTITMRIFFKPEILFFTLLCWILYLIESYLNTKQKILILPISFGIALVASTKATFAIYIVAILIYYLISNFQHISKFDLITSICFALIIFFVLNYENYSINGQTMILSNSERQTIEDYQNIASKEFFFGFNFNDFIRYPYSVKWKNNFFQIILADPFSDYFRVTFLSDSSLINKLNFVESLFKNKFLIFLFKNFFGYFSIIIMLTYYSFLIFNFKKIKRDRFLIYSPIIGLLTLTIHSLGVPFKNFDPSIGDTFKTIYYSPLLIISIILLLNYIFKNLGIKQLLYFSFLVLVLVFQLGFPKEEVINGKQLQYFQLKNTSSITCNLSNIFIPKNYKSNCENVVNYCGISARFMKKEIDQNGNIVFYKDDNFKEIPLINNSKIIKMPKGFEECYYYLENNFYNPYSLNLIKIPNINLSVFLIFVLMCLIVFFKRFSD